MSVNQPFRPKEVYQYDEQRYDALAKVMIKYLEEGDSGFALAVEIRMDALDEEWAKQGEP